MPANPALRDYLLTRRSVGQAFLAEPGPSGEELNTLLTIATRVPDHGKLAPWRLVVFSGDARAAAGEKLAALAQQKRPDMDEAAIEIERRQFLPAPLVIGIISSPKEHFKVPEFEQLISAGNVALNLVHGAYALGYAANWITRWYAFDAEAAELLGARAGERFVGFVHIGTPKTVIEDRPRPDLTEIVTYWS
ncbi:MAG: nitroreductase [Devosia sp.]|jgi:nitroreductase|uniref:nitroreductase family protein n=1 Tax=unclassified Devosia TaxID=196773 RepID=UPI001A098C87|nr:MULTISPECIES: nitroreductase [unclassified Devosia]MBF0680194.1 nitroreductase [Devosia sp.]WEJ34934.1 nitroreductase [Devosia sp. SD17-2]